MSTDERERAEFRKAVEFIAQTAFAAPAMNDIELGAAMARIARQCDGMLTALAATPTPAQAPAQPVAWRVPNKGREGGWLFAEKRQLLAYMEDVPEPLYARPESEEPVARMHVGGLEPFGHAAVIEKLPAADAMPHGDYSLYAAPDHPAPQTPRPNEPELGADGGAHQEGKPGPC